MIVGYGRARTTRDVDARIEHAKDEMLAAAEEIAAEQGLDPNWLNENARLFMPPAKDHRARTVFNTPGLIVTGASAEHMMAMKIDAARNSDEDDIPNWLSAVARKSVILDGTSTTTCRGV